MVKDMLRFHHVASGLLTCAHDDPERHLSLQDYLNKHGTKQTMDGYCVNTYYLSSTVRQTGMDSVWAHQARYEKHGCRSG